MALCLAQQLKHRREERKLSQEHVARMVGISLRTLQRWEKKGNKPSPMAQERIKKVLEVL